MEAEIAMSLLVSDWQARLANEQKRRSVDLLAAAMGSDFRAVDERMRDCDQWDEVRRYAVLLADALWRAGWTETRPTFGPLDEG